MIALVKVWLDKVDVIGLILNRVHNGIGPIVKIETHPNDNLNITWGSIQSEQNTNAKRGMLYIYCDEKVNGDKNDK